MPSPMPLKTVRAALSFAAVCALLMTGPVRANPLPPPAGFGGSSTTLGSTVTGATAGGFLDPVQGYELARSVGFRVVGLSELAVTRWHYTFSGSVAAAADNAALQLSASFAWDLIDAIGALHYTNWGVGWVDGPPAFGDFAGNLANPPGVSAAGTPLPTVWAPGSWGGSGSLGFVTDIPLRDGMAGFFRHAVGMGLSGLIQSTLSVSLVAVTVDFPRNAAFAGEAPYLLLDDGTQFAITSSVPEPAGFVLAVMGLLGLLAHRRLQSRG